MRVRIVVDRFSGSRLEVESVSEDAIVYRSTALKPTIGEVIVPTKQQWERFWSLMELCRDWGPEYINYGIVDGTSWSVDVSGNGISIRSEGANAYPINWWVLKEAIECLSGKDHYL